MPKLGTTGGTVMLRALYAGVFFAMSFASTATADKCLLRSDATGAIETDEEPATFEATSDSRSAREDCGKSSSLLDTYEARSATIRVNIGKGNFVFSPLALYDKNRRVKCNKIKVRTACTRLGDEVSGKIIIELYDKATPSKGVGRFVVSATGDVLGAHSEYALVRAQIRRRGKSIPLSDEIRQRLADFNGSAKSCVRKRQSEECRSNLEAVAEGAMLERLRSERFPRSLSKTEIQSDWSTFNSALDVLSTVETIIHRMMVTNEVGKTSPYELSDATKEASALSFGVRQLDIGANADARKIFSTNIASYKNSKEWDSLVDQKKLIYSASFQAPIRQYTVQQLVALHQSIPVLDNAMRTPESRGRYEEHHRRYLTAEAKRYFQLRKLCLFRDSPFLALAAIDRLNQDPPSYWRILAEVKSYCAQQTPLAEVEDAVAKLFGPYQYRADNIHTIIKNEGLH